MRLATGDVTVVGAGVFGLAIGYCCARRGARVQVIDREGVGAGASGGIVGALSPHVPDNWNAKKQFQFESLITAQDFWNGVEACSGKSVGYGLVGRLQSLPDARAVDLARARARGAGMHWRGKARWKVVRAGACGDWEPVSPAGWLVRDTLSARLHPRRTCASLAGAIRTLGGDVVVGQVVPRGRVVWATGASGLEALSQALGQPVGRGDKGQAALLRYAAPRAPQIFADGLHIVPHDDGTVAVGSTSERDFDAPQTTDAQLDALLERAVTLVPALRGAPVLERWAGLRPRAISRAPILGPWPGQAGHYIANGGFKIGFGMAPKVAEVMADLVLEDRDAVPEGFRVEDILQSPEKQSPGTT